MKYLVLFCTLTLFGCRNPVSDTVPADRFAPIQDNRARAIIQASIETAGGLERWESIKRLSYTKDFNLLLESGAVEVEYRQVHDYRWDPLKIEIQSIENGIMIRTLLENGSYSRTKAGEAVAETQEALEKAVNTATYVVGMPFKLLDSGAVIQYLGEDTLSGKAVDVIQVSYNADQHDHHSTSDVWKYYFDKTDSRIVANWVKSGDHFNLIENLSFEKVGGILFNKKRQSYRVDSLGNKLFLRADYSYGNFRVE